MDSRRRFIMFNKKKTKPTNSGSYTVELNDQWRLSTTVSNPDSSKYEGVYESFSNYNVNNSYASLIITIKDIENFTLYIRSYAESNYDYVMVSQLDKTIDQNTSYLYSELVKAHTRGVQKSGTDIYSYTPVVFEDIDGGEHTITVIYRKDISGDYYDDRGYLLISKDFISVDEDGPGGGEEGGMNINNYLTTEALEDGFSAMLNANACEYCIDGSDEWVSLPAGSYTSTVNKGQKISFRAKDIYPTSSNGIGMFTFTKPCNLLGNCMSMLFGDNAATNFSLSGYDYAFYRMFYNNTNVRSVAKGFLPAMGLSNNCYSNMFRGCSNMTEAPDLPALTLTSYAYYMMFYGCSALTDAPNIMATTLGYQCCYYMFANCSALINGPDLFAETLTSYCYYYMFSNCSNLFKIKMLAIDISASGCMTKWMQKVEKKGGLFYKHINATWNVEGQDGVPKKWTIIYVDN